MALGGESGGPRWFFANLVEVKLTKEAGGGQLSVVELQGPAGDMPPLHVHHVDDEIFYVLDGEVSLFVGDDRPVRLGAGSAAFGPKGVAHTYRVESGTARWLGVCTPGDFATFVEEASRPAEHRELPPPPEGPPSEDEITAITKLAAEHGIELLGPPGTLPGR